MISKFKEMAYKMHEAKKYFDGFDMDTTMEFLLEWYTKLDGVYNLLEKCGVVCIYSKNEILKEIKLVEGLGNIIYIQDEKGFLHRVKPENYINELVRMCER